MSDSIFSELKNFSASEFNHPEKISPPLLRMLQHARNLYGSPIIITSDYRPASHSSHGLGLALDLHCVTSGDRFYLTQALLSAGFKRVGIYDRHIHVDIDPRRPTPVLWTGISQPLLGE